VFTKKQCKRQKMKYEHHGRSALSSYIDWDEILYHDFAKLIDTMVSMYSYVDAKKKKGPSENPFTTSL
ncbi:hypothetical protein L9F63_004090, partial [Diploptera punctata]